MNRLPCGFAPCDAVWGSGLNGEPAQTSFGEDWWVGSDAERSDGVLTHDRERDHAFHAN
jgi:hypothetical protein